tara:strand:- start:7408 stop:8664 length:1257 start_codon:yes stop_codon:yes gene_type:complete
MQKQTLINFSSYLVYFLPLAILTGPLLADFSLSIVSLIFLYSVIKYRDYQYLNNIYFKYFLTFYIYLVFNSLISEYPLFSLENTIFYFRFGIFALAVWYILDNKNNFLYNFKFYLLITFIFALITGYYQYTFSETILGVDTPSTRLLLFGSEKLILGQYLARLLPFVIGFIVLDFKKTFFNYVLLFILFVSTDLLIYLSGERTALGLLIISFLFIIFLSSKLKIFRLTSIFVSILIIVYVSMLDTDIKKRNIDYTINQLGIKQSQTILAFSFNHDTLFKTSLNMFIDNPLFGIGPNNYRKLCDNSKYKINDRSCSNHPHNSYFQILSETGLIGMSLFLLPSLILIKLIYRHTKTIFRNKTRFLNDYQICLIACFVCTLWPIIPTLNFFTNWINVIYYLPVGFFLHSLNNKNKLNLNSN